jgi:hypothetical protein
MISLMMLGDVWVNTKWGGGVYDGVNTPGNFELLYLEGAVELPFWHFLHLAVLAREYQTHSTIHSVFLTCLLEAYRTDKHEYNLFIHSFVVPHSNNNRQPTPVHLASVM